MLPGGWMSKQFNSSKEISKIKLNLQETKKLTNMRASGSDDNVRIAPKINFSLEESMEYIQKDEYLEVTPLTLRIRKIYLDENERKRNSKELEMA